MKIKRVASVIGIKTENIARYEELHAQVWPDVLNRLQKSHVHNYSIYRYENTLFSYLEYTGDDYQSDMEDIAADPITQDWWSLCIPLQVPMEDRNHGEWWMELPEIFHLD